MPSALLRMAATLLGLAVAPAIAAPVTASCPERVRTLAATPADPARLAGFTPVVGGETSSQAFLQDIALRTGSAEAGAPASGKAEGKTKITWTFDGTAEVFAACLYEGGVGLTRALGRPKTCTAALQRSRDARSPEGWGMEKASFRCN